MMSGIKLGKKVGLAVKWVTRPGVLSLIRIIRRTLNRCPPGLNLGRAECIQMGRLRAEEEAPPRGHLAVYVGESDGEKRRVVVPVVYFNNPLFGELLKEAERVYGFDCPGGISIPCGYSKFEKVTMKIDERDGFVRRRGHFLRRWGLVR